MWPRKDSSLREGIKGSKVLPTHPNTPDFGPSAPTWPLIKGLPESWPPPTDSSAVGIPEEKPHFKNIAARQKVSGAGVSYVLSWSLVLASKESTSRFWYSKGPRLAPSSEYSFWSLLIRKEASEISLWLSGNKRSMRTQVWSLALLSGLGSQHCGELAVQMEDTAWIWHCSGSGIGSSN